MDQKTVKLKQLFAEFFSNIAVALVAVGIINPLFFPQKEILSLFIQIMLSLVIAGILLVVGSYLLIK